MRMKFLAPTIRNEGKIQFYVAQRTILSCFPFIKIIMMINKYMNCINY